MAKKEKAPKSFSMSEAARPKNADRNKAIFDAIKSGATAKSVGEQHGVSASSARNTAITYAARNGIKLEALRSWHARGEDMSSIGISLTGEERALMQKAATKEGRKLSQWMREAALSQA